MRKRWRWVLLILLVLAGPLAAFMLKAQEQPPTLRWKKLLVPEIANGVKQGISKLAQLNSDTYLITLPGEGRARVILRSLAGVNLWEFEPESSERPIHNAVNQSLRRISVGSDKGHVYVLDQQGKPVWDAAIPDWEDAFCGPEFAPDGSVFLSLMQVQSGKIGTRRGIGSFDSHGKLRFVEEFPGVVGGITVGRTGLVYGVIENERRLIAVSSTGQELWRTGKKRTDYIQPLPMPDGGVVCHNANDTVSRYSLDGKLLWDFKCASISLSAPMVDRAGHLYFGGFTSYRSRFSLIALDDAGQIKWKRSLPFYGFALGEDSAGRIWLVTHRTVEGVTRDTEEAAKEGKRFELPQGSVLIFNPANGKVLGTGQLPFQYTPLPNLLPGSDSMMLVLGNDGQLYCYEL